jgi:hypothetical protein
MKLWTEMEEEVARRIAYSGIPEFCCCGGKKPEEGGASDQNVYG